MRISIDVGATLAVAADTAVLFQLEPLNRGASQQLMSSELLISPIPSAPSQPFVDFYGNPCRRGPLPQGIVELSYKAIVDIAEARSDMPHAEDEQLLSLPSEAHHYLQPSRYCQSDRLTKLSIDHFGGRGPGRETVEAICRWIYDHTEYAYGATDGRTSAIDTLVDPRGVCRDYAHLAIAFCRALSIPARYVSGYCLGLKPPDFHAWFEAYVGRRWESFDATVPPDHPRDALIAAAIGRDAVDCAWSTLYGAAETTGLSVQVAASVPPSSSAAPENA